MTLIVTYLVVALFLAYVATEWLDDMYTMREHGYMNPYRTTFHGFLLPQERQQERELREYSRVWEKRSLARRRSWDHIEGLAIEGRVRLATVEAVRLVRREPKWVPGWLILNVLSQQRQHFETAAVAQAAIRELMAA